MSGGDLFLNEATAESLLASFPKTLHQGDNE
jgi:hypothetical protein